MDGAQVGDDAEMGMGECAELCDLAFLVKAHFQDCVFVFCFDA